MRETSPLFKRLRRFNRYQLSLHEGAELIAFVRLVGHRHAAKIFGWRDEGVTGMERAARKVRQWEPMLELADRYERANNERMDAETGEALIWLLTSLWGPSKVGTLPPAAQMYLMSLKDQGWTNESISRRFRGRLSVGQVQRATTPHMAAARKAKRAHQATLLLSG